MAVWLLSPENFLYGSILIILFVVMLCECVGLLCKTDLFGLFDQHQFGLLSSKHPPPEHLTSYWYSVSGSGWLLLFLFLFSLQGLVYQFGFRRYAEVMVSEFWIFAVSGALSIVIVSALFFRLQFVMRKALASQANSISTSTDQHELSGAVAQIIAPAESNSAMAEAIVLDHDNHENRVIVKPLESSETFNAGDKVILIHQGMSCWLASRRKDTLKLN
jgi:hypothetical protein